MKKGYVISILSFFVFIMMIGNVNAVYMGGGGMFRILSLNDGSSGTINFNMNDYIMNDTELNLTNTTNKFMDNETNIISFVPMVYGLDGNIYKLNENLTDIYNIELQYVNYNGTIVSVSYINNSEQLNYIEYKDMGVNATFNNNTYSVNKTELYNMLNDSLIPPTKIFVNNTAVNSLQNVNFVNNGTINNTYKVLVIRNNFTIMNVIFTPKENNSNYLPMKFNINISNFNLMASAVYSDENGNFTGNYYSFVVYLIPSKLNLGYFDINLNGVSSITINYKYYMEEKSWFGSYRYSEYTIKNYKLSSVDIRVGNDTGKYTIEMVDDTHTLFTNTNFQVVKIDNVVNGNFTLKSNGHIQKIIIIENYPAIYKFLDEIKAIFV